RQPVGHDSRGLARRASNEACHCEARASGPKQSRNAGRALPKSTGRAVESVGRAPSKSVDRAPSKSVGRALSKSVGRALSKSVGGALSKSAGRALSKGATWRAGAEGVVVTVTRAHAACRGLGDTLIRRYEIASSPRTLFRLGPRPWMRGAGT